MRKTIGEMVSDIKSAYNENEKLALLKSYDCVHLRELLKINFDPSIKFALPEGPVPYRTKDEPSAQTHLMPEWRRFKRIFLEGWHPTLKQKVREDNFIGLLRSLDHVEATIVLELKDKKLSGISRKLVEQAYPGLLEPEASA